MILIYWLITLLYLGSTLIKVYTKIIATSKVQNKNKYFKPPQLFKKSYTLTYLDFKRAVQDKLSFYSQEIEAILNYPLVNKKAIEAANFSIVLDAINSSGAVFVPALLKRMSVD